MAIRFACPSCKQPIEVDDQWGGKSVGCPYCQNAVTAPTSSTWPQEGAPVATPLGPTPAAPPSLVHGHGQPSTATRPGSSAVWAFVLSLASAGLCVLGIGLFVATMMKAVVDSGVNLQPTGTPQEVQQAQLEAQQAVQQMIEAGQLPPSPEATVALLVGIVVGIIALIIAIRSLVRGEGYRTLGIFAILISLGFIFCQGFFTLFMLTVSRG